MMKFETHTPPEPYSKYIESIFHFKGYQPEHSIERVIPTGHLFVLFELDDIPRQTYDNDTLQPQATFQKGWISGMHKEYLSIYAAPDSEMFVIQFKTQGAHPFLHMPISELNNKVLPIEKVLGLEGLSLREALYKEEHSKGKFSLIDKWLNQRFNAELTPTDDLIGIIEELRSNPLSHHNDIINGYDKTQKHLINQFKKYFGLTPKVFHRIFRFNKILEEIHAKKSVNWTDITYQMGYADQSHFIREFNEFSGFNPREFIIADHNKERQNFFPLDQKG